MFDSQIKASLIETIIKNIRQKQTNKNQATFTTLLAILTTDIK